MFDTHCTSCGTQNKIPPHYRNQLVRCRKCAVKFLALEDGERQFKFSCSKCSGSIEAEIRLKGTRAKCPHCKQEIIVDSEPRPLVQKTPATFGSVRIAPDVSERLGNKLDPKPSQFSPAARIIIAVLGLIIVGGGYAIFANVKSKNIYKNDLEAAFERMVRNASEAESICQDHSETWKMAVESQDVSIDSAIEKSKRKNAHRIAGLKLGKLAITSLMSRLQDPPSEYSKIYDKLVTLFGQSNSLTELAIQPNGSLISYTQSVQHLQDDMFRAINEIRIMIPSKT